MSYVTFSEEPQLRKPVLLLAFAGWNDASSVATTAMKFLVTRWEAKKFAEIDPEDFYNFMRVRPQVRIEEDFQRHITWPENTFYYHVDPTLDRDFILLVGIEPSLKWRTFANEVIDVCVRLGVSSSLSLGGLVADVPHTRGARVTAFTTDPDLTERFPELALRRSRYEGPTGILGVLADTFAKSDIPTGSLWGNVPHYISASPNPKVVHGLLARLDSLYGFGMDLSEMERAGRRFERQVNEALAHNPEVLKYVQQLEQRDEEKSDEPPRARGGGSTGAGELPNAADVVRQLEDFLRERASDPPEGEGPSTS
ncbi:MAG: hypothetical protein HW416_1083 [Chloroflexi bacterium]|nr:hypothetical protein [Chloroflexota bacterium]